MKTYFKKNCPEIITERKMSDLSQQLPKSDEWQDFLSNRHNSFNSNNFISNQVLEKASVLKGIHVTKRQFCH